MAAETPGEVDQKLGSRMPVTLFTNQAARPFPLGPTVPININHGYETLTELAGFQGRKLFTGRHLEGLDSAAVAS
jgi:hypothetical protein